MAMQNRKIGKEVKKVEFSRFLCGTPASDYVFSDASYDQQIKEAVKQIQDADAVLIGAGAGLSAAAGLLYGGKRFTENFGEFIKTYGSRYMTDMYRAGFYPFPTEEEKWGYWSKHAMLNRVLPEGLPLYQALYELVKDMPHFVLTTNVDHQFWKAGFEDKNIFATQGDYGTIQCQKGCHPKVYEGITMFRQMDQARKNCRVPSYMVPKCPVCGGNMTMHLRCDQYFVEDDHWHEAAGRYDAFLRTHKTDRVVLLELGVGFNTPTIIRFPFEHMAKVNKTWSLVRLNVKEAVVPASLKNRAVGINEDIEKSVADMIAQVKLARKQIGFKK